MSLLKDSLRIDFSDMRNLECDPQREIADKLFTFEYEGNIYWLYIIQVTSFKIILFINNIN